VTGAPICALPIFFDEPTSGFDRLNEQTFHQEALKLKRAGKSVLLSSHILSEVERMCDSIVIIRDGSVIESGNLDQLRHLSRIKIEVTRSEERRVGKELYISVGD